MKRIIFQFVFFFGGGGGATQYVTVCLPQYFHWRGNDTINVFAVLTQLFKHIIFQFISFLGEGAKQYICQKIFIAVL